MKYLKIFEKFEEFNINEIVDECNDILLELKDLGIKFHIKSPVVDDVISRYLDVIIGERSMYYEVAIDSNQIIPSIEHLISYLESMNLKLVGVDGLGKIESSNRRVIIKKLPLNQVYFDGVMRDVHQITYLKLMFLL